MTSRLLRLLALPVLALGLMLGGCDSAELPTTVVPEAGLLLNASTTGPVRLVRSSSVGTAYMDAWIGPDGGSPQIGPHRLIIPRGAVSEWVRFRAEVTTTGYIGVDLSATARNGEKVGTPAKPFLKPLELRLSYGSALGAVDPSELLLASLADDTYTGRIQGQVSWIDTTNRVVISKLGFFSRYAIGSRRAPGGAF